MSSLRHSARKVSPKVSKLRTLTFEFFPKNVRFKIYRLLLLKLDDRVESGSNVGQYNNDDEEAKFEEIFDILSVGPFETYDMFPAILRTNHYIHAEAAGVLWGENYFTWSLYGTQKMPMWHMVGQKSSTKTSVPRRCSRLITKLNLVVSLRGGDDDFAQSDAFGWTKSNLKDACEKLCLNDLQLLLVNFYNALPGGGRRYWGQDCLVPLKRVRADKFIINMGYVSGQYAAELKAIIESPKGAKFMARRKAKEEDAESEFDVRSECGEDALDSDEACTDFYPDDSEEEDAYRSDGVDDEVLESHADGAVSAERESEKEAVEKPKKPRKKAKETEINEVVRTLDMGVGSDMVADRHTSDTTGAHGGDDWNMDDADVAFLQGGQDGE